MKRAALIGLLAVFTLGACATSDVKRYSYTPKTEVTVKAAKKRDVQANYQVSPEQSSLGSGGSDK